MLPKHVSTLLTTGNEWTRIFHINADEVVVMRHAPLTDALEVTLNGLLVRTIEEPGNKRWFAHKKRKFVLTITSTSNWFMAKAGLGNFSYELEVDGTRIPENNESLNAESDTYPSTSTLRIREHMTQGDKVVWYLIVWPELHVHVHRRYRDFWLLYSQVCSAYRGTHLYSSVPEPPPRELGTLSSNKSAVFLETRMRLLEVWLKKVLGLPGIKGGRNPDVLEFLGIGSGRSGVFETSVVFHEGKLGMKLKEPVSSTPSEGSTFSAQVSDILLDSADSQAAKMDPERIKVGDMITRVGGESALLVGYDKVLALLQNPAHRPVVVHLLGVREFSMPE